MNLLHNILLIFTKPIKQATSHYHKWHKQLIIIDKVIFALGIIVLGLFRSDALMIGIYILLYPYLILTARKNNFYHLYVSSFIALIWILIANGQYGYNSKMLTIFGLNSYPLFAWASGLFGIYLIYSHVEPTLKSTSFSKRFLIFVLIYWVLLIVSETVAYHLFHIKNVSASIYAGLPICNCIHAPWWMQISYFALGPIYFTICELLGLEKNAKNGIKQIVKKKKQRKNKLSYLASSLSSD